MLKQTFISFTSFHQSDVLKDKPFLVWVVTLHYLGTLLRDKYLYWKYWESSLCRNTYNELWNLTFRMRTLPLQGVSKISLLCRWEKEGCFRVTAKVTIYVIIQTRMLLKVKGMLLRIVLRLLAKPKPPWAPWKWSHPMTHNKPTGKKCIAQGHVTRTRIQVIDSSPEFFLPY